MKKIALILLTLFSLFSYSQKEYSFIYQSDSIIKSGVILHENDNFEEAIATYKKVNELDPNYLKAQAEIAISLFSLKKTDEVGQLLGELYDSGKMEEFPDLYIKYGSYLDEVNQLEKAQQVFKAGEKHLSNYVNFLYNYAIHHIKNKNKQEAVNYLKKAILVNPSYASSHFMLGLLAYENGNISEGSLCFVTYLMISPKGRYSTDVAKVLSKKFGENYTDIGNLVFSTSDDNFSELNDILRNQFPLNKNYKLKSKIEDPITRHIQAIVEYASIHKIKTGFFENYYIPWMQDLVKSDEVEALTYHSLLGFEENLGKQLTVHKKKIDTFSQSFIPNFWKSIATQKVPFFESEEKVTIIYSNYRPYLVGVLKADKKEGKFIYLDDYGNKKGVLFFKNDELEGKQIYFDKKGKLLEEKSFSNGVVNGERKTYYENGNLSFIENFKEGKLNGLFTSFYPNGGKQCEVNFVNDERDGELICKYENGTLKSTISFVNGKLNGKFIEFNEVGDITKQTSYINDEIDGNYLEFYNGTSLKCEVNYANGKPKSNFKSYFKNGTLEEEIFYLNGKKFKSVEYHRNGFLAEESFFNEEEDLERLVIYNLLGEKFFEQKLKNGEVKSGLQYYYNTEKPVEINIAKKEFEIFNLDKTKYVSGEFFKGVKKGIWTYYNSNGTIKSKENYVNGKVEGLQYNYDLYGNLTDIYNYKEGKLNGLSEFYKNDKLTSSHYYYNDVRSGPVTYYNFDGNIIRRDFIEEDDKKVSFVYNPDGTINSKTYFIEKQISTFENFESNKRESYVDFTNKSEKLYFTSNNKVTKYLVDLKNGIYDNLYEAKDKNNMIINTINYVNGVKNGKSKSYAPNGKLTYDMNYYSGVLNGEIKYYDLLGNPRLSFTAVFGEVTGTTKRFNADNTLLNEVNEIDDLKNGDYKWYNKKGKLLLIIHYVNDIPVYYIGMDKLGEVNNKTLILNQTATIVSVYPNGKKAFEMNLIQGGINGKIQLFSSEGQPEFYAEYKNNNLHGNRIEYFANGKVYKKESFKDGDYHGMLEYFDDKGNKVITADYKDDSLNGLFQYYENGILKISKKYLDDELVEIIK